MLRLLLLALLLLVPSWASAQDWQEIPISTVRGAPVGHTPSFSNHTLDANDDSIEWIFRAWDTTTISRFKFRYGARNGTPPTFRASLQGCSSSGRADGTIKSSSNAFVTFQPPANGSWDSTIQTVTLGATYTPTRGECLAFVIDYVSGTIDASNLSQITTHDGGAAAAFPYVVRVNGGVATNQSLVPVFGYDDNAGNVRGSFLVETLNMTQFSLDTATIDERAQRFVIPAASCSTFMVPAVRIQIRTPAAGQNFTVTIYEGTTARQTVQYDTDQLSIAATNDLPVLVRFTDSSLYTFDCGTAYYIAVRPDNTSQNIALRELTLDSAADQDAFPGGADWHAVTRVDSGSWDTTSHVAVRYMMDIIIGSMTEPAGGGGGTPYIIR